MTGTMIFSTQSSRYFASLIARALGIDGVGEIERKLFGDGERYYRIGIPRRHDLMGKDVIFVASTHRDSDFMELVRVGTALAEYGAGRRIFVIPFFGYSTMERATKPGEVVTAKVSAKQLSAIPNSGMGNAFLMLDLHVPGMVHYFEGDCLRFELHAQPVLVEAIRALALADMVFASADLGRPLWVQNLADEFGTELAFVSKSRAFDETKVLAVVGEVRDRNVIIYDDMTRSAGTLLHAAEAYLARGARSVYAVLSHCALNTEEVATRLEHSPIVKIITTNSHPMSQRRKVSRSEKFAVQDVSGLFASAIRRILGS